ncbi:MAG: T9SS type A sorting domain-containing protein [Bacteroidales bacterium]|nr:T9SS type A sorting domain-containing protein [Bacteroidales bacterium]
MKKTFTFIVITLLCASAMAQTVTLTFVGEDDNGYGKKLDSVVVSNRIKHWQETLYWPDTVLTIQNGVGVEGFVGGKDFAFSQNYPNPFDGTTFVNLQVAEPGDVTIQMTDITGRIVETLFIASLQPGVHQLRVSLSAAGIYFLTARQAGRSTSMKMVCHQGRGADAVSYSCMVDNAFQLKNEPKSVITRPFDYGDPMEYRGYATFDGEVVESNPKVKPLDSSETISLNFSEVQDGINCPEIPTITDVEGNVYQTVRIGKQCWMRSNLRTKHFADGTSIPCGGLSSSGTSVSSSTSPYYYEYEGWLMWFSQHGLLYNWPATMQGNLATSSVYEFVQGVCPNGWHVPSKTEWALLTDYVRTRPKYRCGGNTYNIAKALATGPFDSDWATSNSACDVGCNTADNNATGFSVFPTGGYIDLGFCNIGYRAYIWSSELINDTYTEYLFMESDATDAYTYPGGVKSDAYAVRCLRDNYDQFPWDYQPCPGTPMVTDYDGNLYPTVQIGSQCWMRYNLRTTHYADGTSIPAGTTQSSYTPYYYNYSTSNVTLTSRGYLYNWPAVMHGANSSSANPSGVQGICPAGWHVPSDAEWTQLENYVGSQSLYIWDNDSTYIACSLASISLWEHSSVPYSIGSFPEDANNTTLFSAVPAGYYNGSYFNFGNTAAFWSSTNCTDSYAYSRFLYNYSAIVNRSGCTKNNGLSVRCVKD